MVAGLGSAAAELRLQGRWDLVGISVSDGTWRQDGRAAAAGQLAVEQQRAKTRASLPRAMGRAVLPEGQAKIGRAVATTL